MPVRAFSPEEVQAGRRRFELSLFLTVFLASAMFALAEGRSLFLLVTAVAVVVHVIAAGRNAEIHVHRTLLNAGVLLVGVALTIRYFTSSQDLLIALGHYVTLIQLCKLFERKKDRDYVQMLVMSLLLVLAAGMMCQELLFAVLGLAYVASLCHTAMVFTIKRSLDVAARQQGPPEGEARRQDWPRRAVLSRLAVVLAAVLATGVVVFLVSPRYVGGAAPPLRRIPRQGASGFTETVRLGEPRSIYLSDRVVMQVRFVSPEGADLGHAGTPYLRGRVFSKYEDSQWANKHEDSQRAKPSRWRQYSAGQVPERILDRAVRQEVSMMPSLLPVAFASYPAIRVVSPDTAVRCLDDLEYELKPPSRLDRPIEYTAYVLPGKLSSEERFYLAQWTGYSAAAAGGVERRPAAPARTEALARQWCEDLVSRRDRLPPGPGRDALDLDIARRLADRLKQRCTYTLDLTDADADRDGVEDFLFHLRRGHCEYFASAMTVMCQGLGVRARLATGFCPAEYDPVDGHYVVRQRDAHAWTEVYTPSTDWVVMDATPAERFAPPDQAAWARWWTAARDLWREWEFAWYARVIAYDDETRQQLASQTRRHLLAAWRTVRQAAHAVAWGLVELFARGRISQAVVWFFLGLAVAAALLAGLLGLLRRGRPPGRWGQKVRAPRPPPFLGQLLELLRRHGFSPLPSQTAQEWAAEAAGRLHLPPAALHELVALYYRIRWARAPATHDELAAAEQQVRRLGEILST